MFLDTSALIAGIVSPTGAAREVLRLCEAGAVELLVSRQVLTEADRNLSAKLPALVPDYRHLMHLTAACILPELLWLQEPSKLVDSHPGLPNPVHLSVIASTRLPVPKADRKGARQSDLSACNLSACGSTQTGTPMGIKFPCFVRRGEGR